MENDLENWQHFVIGLLFALLAWLLYLLSKNHRAYMENKWGKLETYQKMDFVKDRMFIGVCLFGSVIELLRGIF